jgi:hypothetical protein
MNTTSVSVQTVYMRRTRSPSCARSAPRCSTERESPPSCLKPKETPARLPLSNHSYMPPPPFHINISAVKCTAFHHSLRNAAAPRTKHLPCSQMRALLQKLAPFKGDTVVTLTNGLCFDLPAFQAPSQRGGTLAEGPTKQIETIVHRFQQCVAKKQSNRHTRAVRGGCTGSVTRGGGWLVGTSVRANSSSFCDPSRHCSRRYPASHRKYLRTVPGCNLCAMKTMHSVPSPSPQLPSFMLQNQGGSLGGVPQQPQQPPPLHRSSRTPREKGAHIPSTQHPSAPLRCPRKGHVLPLRPFVAPPPSHTSSSFST